MLQLLSWLMSLLPAKTWTPITPSDSAALAPFRALRFDQGGTVQIDTTGSDGPHTAIGYNVSPGEVWPVTGGPGAAITRVYATGTTATGIAGLN